MICQPILNISMIVELFPTRHPVTVYRWGNPKAGRMQLPEPDLTLGSGVKLWTVETILTWASERGLKPDAGVLDGFLSAQSS